MSQLRVRPASMQGWWSAKNTLQDSSLQWRHFTLGTPPPYLTGLLGLTAWDFDGATQYLESTTPCSTFFGTSQLSVFVSFKVHTAGVYIPSPNIQLNDTMIGETLLNANGGGVIVYQHATPGLAVWGPRNRQNEAARVIRFDQWYVGVWQHAGAANLYGALEPFNPSYNSSAQTYVWGASGNLRVGRGNPSARFCDCEIGEILICNSGTIPLGDVATIWNYMAGQVLRRGDPEEQMRDLITKRAIVARRLAYALQTDRREGRLIMPVGTEIAVTHPSVFLDDGGASGNQPYERYEAREVGREVDLDSQTVTVRTVERDRIVALATARADAVGPGMNGSLLMGARLNQFTPTTTIALDRVRNSLSLFQSFVAKMDDRGWYAETGGEPFNSAFVDGAAGGHGFTVAGGGAFQALPAAVRVLFEDTVEIGAATPRSINLTSGAESAQYNGAVFVAGTAGCWLRFFYIGEGTVEIITGTGRTWDWTANGGSGGWITAAAVTRALPLALDWQEFVYGPIPQDAANPALPIWRGSTTGLRLGYASFEKNLAVVATGNTPTAPAPPPSGDSDGQWGNLSDDVLSLTIPLTAPFSNDGALRFRFAPRWDRRRVLLAAAGKVALLKINLGRTGDPTPAFVVAFNATTERLQLITNPGNAVISEVDCSGAFAWEVDVAHRVAVGWSLNGIPPYSVNEIKLWVDSRAPLSIGAFGAGFSGNAPFAVEASAVPVIAPLHPNGIYSDFMITSRPRDAERVRVLEVEA